MKVNINALCTVKLSPWGKVYLWRYLDGVFNVGGSKDKIPEQYESMSKESYVWSLHELAHVFGPHLVMGQSQMPFSSDIDFILKDGDK